MHDSRNQEEVGEEEEVKEVKASRADKKWSHDKFDERFVLISAVPKMTFIP